MAKSKEERQKALQALFGGKDVEIGGIPVHVRPIAFKEVRQFSDAIAKIAPTILKSLDGLTGDPMTSMAIVLLPHATKDLLGIFQACVDVDLDELPHWVLPPLAQVWIEESFGSDEKIRPWMELLSNLRAKMEKATGTNSTSPTSSTSSSPPATPALT